MSERDRVAAEPQCEALTLGGVRCRREGQYDVELNGIPILLCGVHRRQAERGAVPRYDQPPGSGGQATGDRATGQPRYRAWSIKELDWLVAHPEASLAEAAAHLGRTEASVEQRRLRFWREGQR